MSQDTNKENSNSKMSYSSMAGELRKGARLYEVFKCASDAADILANFELEEKRAKKSIKNLTKELEDLDIKCDKAYIAEKKSNEDKLDSEKESVIILKKARVEATSIKAKAKLQADNKILESTTLLNDILEKVRVATNEEEKAINSKNDALSSLAKVEKQVQETKDKFLKTLG